jgi:Tetratricopeptide repeat
VTTDREQVLRRVLAFAGLWLLLAGLLSALSFFLVAFIATLVPLLVACAAGAVWLLRRYRVEERLAGGLARMTGGLGRVKPPAPRMPRAPQLGIRRQTSRAGRQAGRLARATPGQTRTVVRRGGQLYAAAVYGLAALTSRLVEKGNRRRALRLNEHGANLRRRGHPEQAIAQHRVALAIVREVGDQQAEAMTLNNLALALAQDGAEEAAVQHLEEALLVLRQLGDEEHEGQVMANLGLVHGRQGDAEKAVHLLNEALDKLPRESMAYRQVEEQLQRAS